MSEDDEINLVLSRHKYALRAGVFFSTPGGRPLGSGLILRDCYIPHFDERSQKYLTGKGVACVLTHECDLDPNNERFFNDKVLIAPIIDFRIWFGVIRKIQPKTAANIATAVVKDEIFRVFYLPTIPNTQYTHGGIIYLNEISNIPVGALAGSGRAICSLTEYSHQLLDFKIQNHLFRPKAAPLMRLH